jgi:hypothetical protein
MVRKPKDTNLKLVETANDEDDRWGKAEKELRITAAEAKQRVRTLREELEGYRAQIEAVPFDIPYDSELGVPCLEGHDRQYTPDLAANLDPRVNVIYKLIDEYADQHGCNASLDFNAKLFAFRWATADAAYRAGVLAGVIFAGCPKEQVDRFERGLAVSLTTNNPIVKKED